MPDRHQRTSYAADVQVLLEDLPKYHFFLKTNMFASRLMFVRM